MRDIEKKRAANRKWHHANKDKQNAASRRYHATHKEAQKESYRKRRAALSAADLEKERARGRRRRGVKDAPGEQKTGICPGCRTEKKLVLDHDHKTGKIRDWICSRCNTFLGMYETRKADGTLQWFADYLVRHDGRCHA